VTIAEPLFPSLVAVMVSMPGATPVTRPRASTVATDVSLAAHVTVAPFTGFPAESVRIGVSHSICPSTTLDDSGLTATDVTGAGGGGGGGGG
jgi:hypothetical protein